VSAPDLFKLELPGEEPEEPQARVVVRFPGSAEPPAEVDALAAPTRRASMVERFGPARERVASGWRTAWVGDGILGMRPRPVVALARQFWTQPPPYIRDALVLRALYAAYGAPVIVASAAAHLLLLVISYPSLLAAVSVIVAVIVFT
jgi:hypothetical protein